MFGVYRAKGLGFKVSGLGFGGQGLRFPHYESPIVVGIFPADPNSTK